MRASFYRVLVTDHMLCVYGCLITRAGGVVTLDMIMHLIEKLADRQLALEISDALIYSTNGDGNEPAHNSLKKCTGFKSRKLVRSFGLSLSQFYIRLRLEAAHDL